VPLQPAAGLYSPVAVLSPSAVLQEEVS